jgi:hypothetical protein
MSNRPHGRFTVDPTSPRARGVCDRCGFWYQLNQLQWQYQWAGARLQNLRILVCPGCTDKPQIQLKSIIIPPDPLPVMNPRPEANIQDNNPISPIGQNALPYLAGTNIGTLIHGAGTYAAFDSNTNKPFRFSAYLGISYSGYGNWVGKNWAVDPSGVSTPSALTRSTPIYQASGFTLIAPNDTAFLGSSYATPYRFQGSSDGYTWTTLYSSTTDGTVGQEITVTSLSGTNYQFHRVDFYGDGSNPVSIAQFEINASAVELLEITGSPDASLYGAFDEDGFQEEAFQEGGF